MHTHTDVIDIVNDQLSGSDYKKDEDPSKYTSQKTGRGPLAEDWISDPPNGVIMCSYKLIKVTIVCRCEPEVVQSKQLKHRPNGYPCHQARGGYIAVFFLI